MNKQTAQMLEKHFDTAFAAPDCIKKLRELILTLAIQGKLVPQDPNDQPASELLKEIEAEKKRLVKEGKIKAGKPLPEIKPEEVPFKLPKVWEWVRLGELFRVSSGNNLTKVQMVEGPYPVYGGNGITGYHCEFNTEKPTIVIGRVGYYCGSIHLTPEKAWITDNAFFTIYDEARLFQQYVIWLFKTINLQVDTSSTAQPVISGGKIYPIPIPIPPLAEQCRIVAKIDQLMAHCDELEKLRAEREQERVTVHTAALNRLLTATESDDFDTSWRFITHHFGELYSVKENVTELRKAILQLAVMGKLVPQNPNDQPASELLKEIEAEKKRLVKEGKIKASEPFPEIKKEDQAHPLPSGWEWVRLGEIVTKIGSGSTPRGGKSAYVTAGIPFLRSQNIWNDGLRLNDVAFISPKTHELMSGTKVAPLDILLNITGASLGRCALVPDDIKDANVSQHVTIIRTVHQNLSGYIHLLLLSPYCQTMIWTRQVGMAREGLSKKVFEQFEIPLPPLAEQHRIVAKIDQLMALCDELEQRIDDATGKKTALLNAVMAQV